MNKKRFYLFKSTIRGNFGEVDKPLNNTEIVDLLNEQQDTINKQENEIMKLKSLLNFSEKMMDTDLIINLRYSYGKWNADLRVIDDE